MSIPAYSPLIKSVSLLAVDDEPHQREMYRSVICEHSLMRITTVASAGQAKRILDDSSDEIHICLLDLGIDDIDNDEFYLLKEYGSHIPFIIASGARDMERAYLANSLGAAALLAKPVDLLSKKFWTTIQSVFCNKVILPSLIEVVNPMINKCCNILIEQRPATITDWAHCADITNSYLRRTWIECFEIAPKYFHFLYLLYQDVFDYYNKKFLSAYNELISEPREPKYIENYRKIKYYLDNKEIFKSVLNKKRKPSLVTQREI